MRKGKNGKWRVGRRKKPAGRPVELEKMDVRRSKAKAPSSDEESGANNLGVVLNRITRRLVAMGLSDRSASLKAGMSADLIRSMRKQWRTGKQSHATNRSLGRLAEALETPVEWLARGEGQEHRESETKKAARVAGAARRKKAAVVPKAIEDLKQKAVVSDLIENAGAAPSAVNSTPMGTGNALKITGTIAAGKWVNLHEAEPPPMSVTPDSRYLQFEQKAYLIEDNSADLLARPGDVVIAVDMTPRPGDHVIIYRIKDNMREITIRKFARHGYVMELSTSTSDADMIDVIRIPDGATQTEKGYDFKLEGIVVSVFRPL